MSNINEVVDVEETGLVHQAKPGVADVPMEVGKNSLDSLYDHYQKKLYVFDRSWSMDEGMLPEDEAAMYVWDEDTLKKFRDLIKDELLMAGVPDPDDDAVGEIVDGDDEPAEEEDPEAKEALTDDKKLIAFVVKTGLHRRPGMEPKRDGKYVKVSERKIEAVRGAMKKFVERRFKKYSDAQVGMIGFGSSAHMMCYPGAPAPEVMLAIDALSSDLGGTDIVAAIKHALSEFKARPSHVGSHHIVMVTDAEAQMRPEETKDFLHQMKEMNVCFDFIFVKGATDHSGWGFDPKDEYSLITMLKRMCNETGGEYQEVRKSSDFEEKFFKASERKALPPYQGGR